MKVDVDQIGEGPRKRTTAFIHRMLMETFYPVEGMENLVIDHIDGNRSNNDVSNLRWITKQENDNNRIENHKEINKEINRLISTKGYEKTLQLLKELS